MADGQVVVYRKGEYSLKRLETIINLLVESMQDLDIAVLAVDQYTNRIQVVMNNDNSDIEAVIELVGDEVVLQFDRIVEKPTEETIYTVYNGSATGNASIAVGAMLNGAYGFITAAHCGNIGDPVTYNGVLMGYIAARQYGGSGGDVAFVERSYS